MHELYALKEKLFEDLSKYGEKRDLGGAGLEVVDKLAHAAKNVCKVIQMCEEEQGGSYEGGSYLGSYRGGSYEGGSNRGSYGMSGYSRNGSYARGRDSMGRYSRANDEMVQRMQELMKEAPNDQIRQSMQKLIEQMEQA